MMEIIHTILMIVGTITLLWLLVKIIKGVPVVLGEFLEAGFRNKFPNDFMMYFEWIVSEMKLRGYNEVRVEDAGSEYPGLVMKKGETGPEIEIRLHAPLLSESGYSIMVTNHENETAIVMRNVKSEENKRLLMKFLE